MPPFSEAIKVWTRIALLSFGGPAGQIALMHRELVEQRRWIGEQRFLHALNYCMLLPGPEAQQLATYIGWLMHGVKGGLVAGGLFILPGMLAILGLSWLYVLLGQVPVIEGLFFGLKAAVLAIVVQAVVRIARRALRGPVLVMLAVLAFIALAAFQVPFPLVIAGAALLGAVLARTLPGAGGHAAPSHGVADQDSLLGDSLPDHARVSLGWSLRLGGLLALLWLGPVLALVLLAPETVYRDIAVFFSQMAMVTFGGAYAVLAYVAQQAVDHYGWLSTAEMVDGLGLAETTPGPLIMVLQFVGFLGGYRDPGALPPLLGGTLAALLTTWVTFVPCFLWIFVGAPFVETLRGNRALAAALTALTAAVVGVIATLALWFALHVLFRDVQPWAFGPVRIDVPTFSSIDPMAAVLAAAALTATLVFKRGAVTVLLGCALAGMAIRLGGL